MKARALTVNRSIYDKPHGHAHLPENPHRLRGLLAPTWPGRSKCDGYRQHRGSGSGGLGLSQRSTAIALTFFGVGSMTRLDSPRLLDKMSDRMPMLVGTVLLVVGLGLGIFLRLHHAGCALDAAGRGLARSDAEWSPAAPFSTAEDRPALSPPSLHCRIHAGW
jgi:hypothetical protein